MRLSITALAGVSVLALTQFASAADLPRKAVSPVVAPIVNWTGSYAGINAGIDCFARNRLSVASSGVFNPPGGFNPAIVDQGAAGSTTGLHGDSSDRCGFIGGVQLGYNWQAGTYVYGVETDIQGVTGSSHFSGTTFTPTNNGVDMITHIDATKRVDWLGTLRGRVGFLATPTTLFYVTGGLAYGGVKSNINISQVHGGGSDTFGTLAGGFSDTNVGWTVGAGLEWMFAPGRWTAKLEYLYYDLGDATYNGGVLSAAFQNGFVRYGISSNVSTRYDGHIGRLGVNYRF